MHGKFAGAMTILAATGAIALAAKDPPKAASKTDDKAKKPTPEFKSPKDKASFAIGLNIGHTILRDFGRADAIDTEQFAKGLKSGLAGDESLDRDEIREAIISYRVDVVKADAVKFLDDNKKKEGVKATSTGLQYQVIKSGDGGKKPTADNTVKVHYTGTLVNGSKFDSSVDRGEPAEFPLTRVIAGWTEGLQLMKVGDKFRFFVPPELGYKDQNKPGIPPHSVLIFEVELLEVK